MPIYDYVKVVLDALGLHIRRTILGRRFGNIECALYSFLRVGSRVLWNGLRNFDWSFLLGPRDGRRNLFLQKYTRHLYAHIHTLVDYY